MSAKKEVRFREYIGKFDVHGMDGVQVALLAGVEGHYRLGNADTVRTSPIVRFEGDPAAPTLIETQNTIYVLDTTEPNRALRCAC